MDACSNCGLENGRDVFVCAGCGSELLGPGVYEANAVPLVPSDQVANFAGALRPPEMKSLRVRILEWFLVLFAGFESGIVYLPYHLYLTRGSLRWTDSWDALDWIHYLLRNGSALGILGYVLFRNSRWCQAPAARVRSSENVVLNTEGSRTLGPDSGLLPIVELLLVLSVALASGILYSFEVLVGHTTIPDEPRMSSLARDVYQVLGFAGPLALLSYVLSRRSWRFRDLGLGWTSREVAAAVPLALGAEVADWLLGQVTFAGAEMLRGHGSQTPDIGNYLFGSSISMVTVLNLILNGFFEELIIRGYLMTEVKRFSGSILLAILCSVGVEVSGHFYQGGPAALAHAAGFMVFAGYYANTNRILPPILAHIAFDLYYLVVYALSLT
jgi:membrane protease YdiL (CAAX protease family)